MSNNKTGLFEGDNLLNQIVNISKAGAYDVLVDQVIKLEKESQEFRKQVKELQAENKMLFDALKEIKGYNAKILPYTWATYKEQIDIVINQIIKP